MIRRDPSLSSRNIDSPQVERDPYPEKVQQGDQRGPEYRLPPSQIAPVEGDSPLGGVQTAPSSTHPMEGE